MANQLTEEAAATAFAKAWNCLQADGFLVLLANDARYTSQWVFEELEGVTSISDYLRGKMQTLRDLKSTNPAVQVRVETRRAIMGDGSPRPCAVMTQGPNGDITAVALFTIQDKKIKRYDLCMPEFFEISGADLSLTQGVDIR